VPWVVGNAIGLFAEQLVDLTGESRAAGLYGLAGIAIGWCWYALYPRPLVDRLRVVGIIVAVASLFALVLGGQMSHPTVRSMIGVGVLGGLILAETRWPGGDLAAPGTGGADGAGDPA